MSNLQTFVQTHLTESVALQQQIAQVLPEAVAQAAQLLFECLANDGKILVCGNGTSAANAQSFASTLSAGFERERMPLAAIALSADNIALTAISNDGGFEQIFSKQVAALGRSGDVLLAISTSGNSKNVVAAMQTAYEHDMCVIALTGNTGGQMANLLKENDVWLNVNHSRTARIEEGHLLILHALADALDAILLDGLA
ncbi:MAG: SIS domain-containing protein [Neisseria sp.]|nr:SIS domain-containing protein [Neisseria sp.]